MKEDPATDNIHRYLQNFTIYSALRAICGIALLFVVALTEQPLPPVPLINDSLSSVVVLSLLCLSALCLLGSVVSRVVGLRLCKCLVLFNEHRQIEGESTKSRWLELQK